MIEFARSKDQPWVDLVNGMYDQGTIELPFSFILAAQATQCADRYRLHEG